MTTMQLPLLQPDPFVPLPQGSAHYVAVLQNRSGELNALQHASTETWSRLTPLLHIVGRRTAPDTFRSENVSSWVGKIAAAVGDHAVFLDILRMKPTHPVMTTKGSVPLLERIYWAARRRGLKFVPVVWVGKSDAAHVKLVHDAVDIDCRGVALRYPICTLALEATKQKAYFARVLDAAGADATSADLLIDLDYLDPDVEIHAEDLGPAIAGAMGVGDWRSVVLFGTSMPSMLGCIPEGTLGSLERKEWAVWTALSKLGLTRLPSYGDYAIQHPTPPQDGGGPSMRANIRYTVDDVTLVARGHGPVIQEGPEQYVSLCRELVARDEFAGGDYTWGDRSIEDCANGVEEPGSQNVWRGAGTSHHLRFVTDQLQRRAAAA